MNLECYSCGFEGNISVHKKGRQAVYYLICPLCAELLNVTYAEAIAIPNQFYKKDIMERRKEGDILFDNKEYDCLAKWMETFNKD
tara:strand:+ start:612 stop:866 length:255 start_codon:yes stop_codon:yes gene_type:complete